ncbi:MAG TPA: DegT/DnrJ/EryC1/StrS family aminotransferase [Gemmatimonadaceae bacterium]|nr:DegT/DnrJ/EryC1/StrS family aminotransferase [Gemmatimonadaceae bacterium]
MTTSLKAPDQSVATAGPAIPFFNYRGAFAAREEEFLAIIRDVLRRGAFIQQKDLAEFEEALAQYLGVKHALGVGNATDGLIFAFRAAGLQPGDEVIFPSHTMVASPAAVAHVGGVPVPVDCGPDHLIDPLAVAAAITDRTRAIMPVHLNGRTCDMDALGELAAQHGLMIIEDAAQALGSMFRGRYAGTFGRAAAFSFYPAKILGCFGDGGAVVTDDDAIAERVRLLRDHGRNEQGEVELWGFNSRLDNMQAAILHAQFRDYGTIVSRRRDIARLYNGLLSSLPEVTLPPAPDSDAAHFDVFQNYEIEAERRDELRSFLAERGVGTIVQWGGTPVHKFSRLGFDVVLPATERVFERCLMLPMNMMVTDDEVERVATLICEFYRATD